MKDFTADHIDSELSRIVMDELSAGINEKEIEFYPGVSYRNIMVWRNFPYSSIASTTPPHDIQDLNVSEYLPKGEGAQILTEFMKQSGEIIENSEKIIEARITSYNVCYTKLLRLMHHLQPY